MRRLALGIVGLAAAAATTGCIGVDAGDRSCQIRYPREVVAVGNDVYVVNTKTGEAKKVDLSSATAFVQPKTPKATVTAGESE